MKDKHVIEQLHRKKETSIYLWTIFKEKMEHSPEEMHFKYVKFRAACKKILN